MSYIDNVISIFRPKAKETFSDGLKTAILSESTEQKIEARSFYIHGYGYNVHEKYYDGEKTTGHMGNPVVYIYNYEHIRIRGRQIYDESDIVKTFINNYVEWVCGAGLKIQAEPVESVIKSANSGFDVKKFIAEAEARFRIHLNSRHSTRSKNRNAHALFRASVLEAIIEGDCLIVDRYEKGVLTVDAIPGRRVKDPNNVLLLEIEARGNKVVEGVEIDKNGTHVAFWVENDDFSFTRIEAIGKKTGRLQASLMYGSDLKVGGVRGLPASYASLEKLKNCDALIESVVSGAVKAANFAIIAEHNHFSDGSPIAMQGMISALENPKTIEQSENIMNTLKQNVTNIAPNSLFEAPIGVSLKTMPATSNANIGSFIETVIMFYSASIGIPYEVGTMIYKNSFSASRMSSQSFQQILFNKRALYTPSFYGMMYETFVEIEVLNGRITAPGYIDAIFNNDYITKEAYLNSRYIGPRVPQADPSKEIKAGILALQHGAKTHEQLAEENGGGDYSTIITTQGDEYRLMLKHIPKEYQLPTNAETSTAEFGKEPKTKEKTVKEPK